MSQRICPYRTILTATIMALDKALHMGWYDIPRHAGTCRKIVPDHVNDLTIAMYNGQDLGPLGCLLKDLGSMSCALCFCHTPDMPVS